MSDSWKIKIFGKGTTYPFVLIDNWFLPHEEEAVWSEIDFYLRNVFIFKSAGSEEDSVARNPDKTSKAQNKRLFLDDLYKNRGASHIINCLYKQRQPFFKKLFSFIVSKFIFSSFIPNIFKTFRDDDGIIG